MPKKDTSGGWKKEPVAAKRRTSRSGTTGPAIPAIPSILSELTSREGVTIAESFVATTTRPVARGAAPPPFEHEVNLEDGEGAVLILQRPSGAFTLHPPTAETATRGATAGRKTRSSAKHVAQFRVQLREDVVEESEGKKSRGPITRAIKALVVKVAKSAIDAIAGRALAELAIWAEERRWKKGKPRGLVRVGIEAGKIVLSKVAARDFARNERALLLIHGTFSDTEQAFEDLATSGFLGRIAGEYPGGIFALNHYTFSQTPSENAADLLAALPVNSMSFDVITHSRGGLILRDLVEGTHASASSRKFRLDRAVLVQCPNEGTPLANPARWEETIGVFGNIAEMFPGHPWVMLPGLLSEAIVWIAGRIAGEVPGLAAMNPVGSFISKVQGPPVPPANAYSAVAANYHPTGIRLTRLLDLGVDWFFGMANDLVVPAAGAWRVDSPAGSAVASDRIACFGPGGNVGVGAGSEVHHLNIFAQPETRDFIESSLKGIPSGLGPIDPNVVLPKNRILRGFSPSPASATASASTRTPATRVPIAPRAPVQPLPEPTVAYFSDAPPPNVLHLMIVEWQGGQVAPKKRGAAVRDNFPKKLIIAVYGGARVCEPFPTKKVEQAALEGLAEGAPLGTDNVGDLFHRVIETDGNIRNLLDGLDPGNLKLDLQAFGIDLFKILFRGNVRRLYDAARSEPRTTPLNVIFTCTVPWISAKPWEFAFDPTRRKFLATEEVHFVRNAMTAVPSEYVLQRRSRLRLLIVSAQPIGDAQLSLEEEEVLIRERFRDLSALGLVDIHVLSSATPGKLHAKIEAGKRAGITFDIVHFMGHGEWDEMAEEGVLLFVTADGRRHPLGRQSIKEILCGRGIQLVFLNACESGTDLTRTSSNDDRASEHGRRNNGIAQALMEGGIPAVVGNQYKVLDPAAVAFAERFYCSLSLGASFGEAAREARIALNYAIDGDAIDWAVPVLYAQDPNRRLCQAPPASVALNQPFTESLSTCGPAAAKPVTKSRARSSESEERAIRVGVADLASVFPGFEETLTILNGVQDAFEFTPIRMMIPLGHLSRKVPTEATKKASQNRQGEYSGQYLIAERLAPTFQKKFAELNVGMLVCFTDLPLQADGMEKIYFARIAKNIGLFSSAFFDTRLFVRKPRRIIANLLAAAVAEELGELTVHEESRGSCPMFFNEDRDTEHISGPQVFDKECRAQLRAKISAKQLDAIEKILRVE